MFSLQFLGFCLLSLYLVRCERLQACEESLSSCLIEALEIEIPDSSTKIGLDTLRLRHLKCNQGQIGGLQSSLALPSNLNGELTDVRLHCDGSYSYGLIHGNLDASIKISSLALDTAVSKDPQSQYPIAMSSSSCRIPSFEVKLTFTGGAAGAVLNAISPLVESMIKDNVKSKVCSKLTDLVSVDGSSMLVTEIDPTIKRIIDFGTPDIPESSDDPSLSIYVHWADSLLASANEFVFDDYSGRFGSCFFGNKMKSITNLNDNILDPYPLPMDNIISHLTNGTGTWAVDLGTSSILPIPSDLGSNTSIKFQRMSLEGFESLTVLDVMHPSPIYNLSVGNSFYMGHLNVEIDFSVCSEISGVTLCEQRNSTLMTKLENVTVTINCTVGAVQQKLNSMHLEDLFSVDFWFSAIDFFNISSLSLQSDVESIAIQYADTKYEVSETNLWTSNLDTGIEYLIDNALQLLVSDYKSLMESVISAAVQGPGRHMANQYIAEQLAKRKVRPQKSNSHYGGAHNVQKKGDDLVINWADFEPLELYRNTAAQVTSEDLNHFVKCLSQRSEDLNNSYSRMVPSHPRSYAKQNRGKWIEKRNTYSAESSPDEITVSGLNSFYEESVFEPFASDSKKAHNLMSNIGVGSCNGAKCQSLDLHYTQYSNTTTSKYSMKSGSTVMNSVSVSLENFHVQFEVLSELTMGMYRSLQLGQLAKPGCAISIFQSLSLQSLALQVSDATFYTGRSEEHSDTIEITSSMKTVFKMLSTPGSIVQLNNFLSQYSVYAKSLCQIGLRDSPESAPAEIVLHSAKSSDTYNDAASISFYVLSATLLLLIMWISMGKVLHSSCGLSCFYSSSSSEGNAYVEMKAAGSIGDEISNVGGLVWEGKKSNHPTPSLMFNKDLNLYTRLFLLKAVISTTALFVYSNISMDAVAVIITISSGVFSSIPEPVLSFGLIGSIVGMWEAKVYILSILVAFLSGLWPYIKLFSLLACLLLPSPTPRETQGINGSEEVPSNSFTITVKRRHDILQALESLGKWGLLDFYVMVLMMCAFHFNLKMPMANSLVPYADPVLVEVLVKPNFGFFSFLLATMASHVLSHLILGCHRHAVKMECIRHPITCSTLCSAVSSGKSAGDVSGDKHTSEIDTAKYRLKDCEFSVFTSHLWEKQRYSTERSQRVFSNDSSASHRFTSVRLSSTGKKAIPVFFIFLLLFIVISTVTPSFSFEFEGLVGYLLKQQGGRENIVAYSFHSVGIAMLEASGLINSIGAASPQGWLTLQILVMQVCYLSFGLLAPLLLLLSLIVMWGIPLSRSGLSKALIVTNTISAWTAVDVFCVSIAAALLEIRQFASFIVGDHCSDIDNMASYFLPAIAGKDMKCFDVVTSLKMVRASSLTSFHDASPSKSNTSDSYLCVHSFPSEFHFADHKCVATSSGTVDHMLRGTESEHSTRCC